MRLKRSFIAMSTAALVVVPLAFACGRFGTDVEEDDPVRPNTDGGTDARAREDAMLSADGGSTQNDEDGSTTTPPIEAGVDAGPTPDIVECSLLNSMNVAHWVYNGPGITAANGNVVITNNGGSDNFLLRQVDVPFVIRRTEVTITGSLAISGELGTSTAIPIIKQFYGNSTSYQGTAFNEVNATKDNNADVNIWYKPGNFYSGSFPISISSWKTAGSMKIDTLWAEAGTIDFWFGGSTQHVSANTSTITAQRFNVKLGGPTFSGSETSTFTLSSVCIALYEND